MLIWYYFGYAGLNILLNYIIGFTEYYSAVKKEWNLDTCYNMHEPSKHAKWSKPDTEGQILYHSTYMKYLE